MRQEDQNKGGGKIKQTKIKKETKNQEGDKNQEGEKNQGEKSQ